MLTRKPDVRRASRTASRIRRVLIWLVVIYVAWCSLLFFFQGRLLYLPGLAGAGLSDALIPGNVERLWIEPQPGVRVEGWLVRPALAADGPAPLVVFTHGNAELIDHCMDEAEKWARRGYMVLLPEYRGYGRSGGRPAQAAIVADALALIEEARRRGGVDVGRTIFHGRSLGAAVAAQVAARADLKPAALILESPFTSVASFAWGYGVPPMLVTNPFRTDRVLADLTCPILILHSRNDEIVPFAHGQRLAAINASAKLIELDGSHNAGLSSQRRYWEAVDALMDNRRE